MSKDEDTKAEPERQIVEVSLDKERARTGKGCFVIVVIAAMLFIVAMFVCYPGG